ncbi:TonB-dependent siderophore receptor [Verticiella sediminum]|uniref:TonB-dependent siderophore receptor n=1 Tax=Verticiella sediminum TaxID=1247510 RepID=A0A556AF84_9BURK|nr:TonB-dependent siderophore receptor [Verticiella sediminum]
MSHAPFRVHPLAAAMGCTLLAFSSVHAQTAAPVSTLSPIRVEAQAPADYGTETSASIKYTAPLVDTPHTVTVIPRAVIDDTASTTLVEALRTTPGITFGAGEGGNPLGDRPFIRGYDAQASTFVDGMRDIGATSREVFNLEQVEVSKGPDGAYGGRGGAGGSLNLISKTPRAENFTNASLSLGTDAYKRATVDGNWKLSDTAAFRLNAMGHDANVPGRDKVDNRRWGIAPSLSLGLGTPTRATFSFYHLKTDDLPDSGIPFQYGTAASIPAGVTEVRPVDVDRHNFYGLTNSDFRETRSDIGTFRLEHDLAQDLTVRNTLRYTNSAQDYIWTQPDDSQGNVNNGLVWRRANTRTSRIDSLANQTEIFGKRTLGGMQHSFTAGVELSREKGESGSYTVARGSGSGAANACANGVGAVSSYNCTSLYDPNPDDPWTGAITRGERSTENRTTTKSVYAFDTVTLTDQWLVNLGLRVDDYDTRYRTPTTSVDRDDTLFNYQAGVIYKPATNGSIYLSYGTSSTPSNATLGEGSGYGITPGRGNVGLNAADLAPEKTRSVELGTKWNVFDEKLALSAAIFRLDTTNARVTLPDNTYAMAGKRRINGLELGFAGNVTQQWQVFGGYTLLDSEVRDDGTNSAAAGQPFPNTPKHSASLWTTYAITPDISVGAGAFYVGKQYGSNAAVRRMIPGYVRYDAMAAYRINPNLDLQLNILNLTNKYYFTSTYSTHYASVGAGRAAILSLNAKY